MRAGDAARGDEDVEGEGMSVTRELTEGYVVKGGRNQGESQIKERPPAPGAIPVSEWSPTIGQPEAANSVDYAVAEYTCSVDAVRGNIIGDVDTATINIPQFSFAADPYTTLRTILDAAFNHAATGKGKERHARDLPFDDQPIMQTTRLVGPGFPLGQAIKKAGEAAGMIERGELTAAEAECLGAINYLAGAVAWMREQK